MHSASSKLSGRRVVFVSLICVLFLLDTVTAVLAQSSDDSNVDARAASYRQFMIGLHLEDEDDLDGAIDALRASASLDPLVAEPLAELAALFARAGRSEDAIAAGEEALNRETDNQTAHRILGLTYAVPVDEQSDTPRDSARAISHLEQARGTLLPDLQVEFTLARLYFRSGANDDAVELLEELVRDEPGFVEAVLLLVQAYEQLGRPGDALTTLETVATSARPSFRVVARLGDMYERRRRWRDAIAAYERAVALNPRNANVRRRLARALLAHGETERGREVLEELIGMRPRDTAGLQLLAELELELNNFVSAESVARQIIELEPEGLRGPLLLAQVFGERREYQSIVDTLRPVIDRDEIPSNAQGLQLAGVYGRLGAAYQQLGDDASAVMVYEEALEIMPGSPGFKARLVRAYADAERFDDAVRILETARSDHPADLTLVLVEAELYSSRGNADRSETLLLGAVENNQSEPRGFVALANFYSQQGRADDAVTVLESAEQRFPEDNSILFQLGAVFEQGDRFVDAEQTFRRVLTRDPNHAPTLNYLGYMLADRGERLEESVALIERAVENDPHNGSYLDSLGWAYFKLDRLDLAEPPLRAAGEQLQRNSVVQDHLGDLLVRLGRYSEAIEAWQRALDGDGEAIDSGAIEQKIDDTRRRVDR